MTTKVAVVLVASVLATAIVVSLVALLSTPEVHPQSVTLTWQAPVLVKDVPIVGYNVYRGTTPSGPYVSISSRVTATKYVDTIVGHDTTFYYVVTSIDQTGKESRYSKEVSSSVP